MRTRQLWLLACLVASGVALGAAEKNPAEASAGYGSDWTTWRAHDDVSNMASLQRGARNFMSYCLGCHGLKYERYSRLANDLDLTPEELQKYLIAPGDKATDYILTTMPQADAATWFGKPPPDLSLMARARGTDYIYQFLKTFYVDPSKQTGANNLRLDATAMPAVLSELEGLKRAVFKDEQKVGADGKSATTRVFDHFEQVAPGRMDEKQYDQFVHDTVNFLDYVSEPTQEARRALGIWVVLFLLVFTWLAWLLKQEYWKDVH
jgi:ubiquinol-cytochrome c reductase cytochrome c1 subunit